MILVEVTSTDSNATNTEQDLVASWLWHIYLSKFYRSIARCIIDKRKHGISHRYRCFVSFAVSRLYSFPLVSPLQSTRFLNEVIFPYFRRVTKHEPVVYRQQGSDSLTMNDDVGDCRI